MDASPLIKAHDHARAASNANHSSDSTVAVSEHALAAGEFANAAKNTSSIEALRTLKLLEEHHRKLSELLRRANERPIHNEDGEKTEREGGETPQASADERAAETKTKPELPSDASAPKLSAASPPSAVQRRYPPPRELSSSIASNLASARGIRSKYRGQPLTPSVSNDQAPGSIEPGPRKDGSRSKIQDMLDQTGKPSWVPPPTVTAPKAELSSPAPESPKTSQRSESTGDEGYSRFYSAFGSILNRISAPLAFAGLPLIAEESTPESAPTPETSPRRTRTKPSPAKMPQSVSADPDLSKIYSRATLQAISRDGHAPNDSFYVVPTSGHTMSYANILSFEQKERRRIAASVHSDDISRMGDFDDDDFVDARESQMAPTSPTLSKRAGRSRTERELYNVIEELNTENASLKDMLDKLSKRLHAFETSAQRSGQALQESMRFRRSGSPHSLASSGGPGPAKAQGDESDGMAQLLKKNKELEDELVKMMGQMELLEKEYGRLQKTVVKYRDKWEKLKAGAKARREAQGSATADNAEASRAGAA